MNSAEEIPFGLVVSGRDSPELLEFGEEILDQVASLVEVAVVVAGNLAVGLGKDHRRLSGGCQRFDHPLVSVERLVGDYRVGLHIGQQSVGPDQVVGLPASQKEAGRVAERVDHRVDLRAQSTARTPDRLVTIFLGAPALC